MCHVFKTLFSELLLFILILIIEIWCSFHEMIILISALYKDEDSTASFYAGIIAETPNGRNNQRFVIQ